MGWVSGAWLGPLGRVLLPRLRFPLAMALSKLITIQVSLLGGSARRWQGGASGEGSQALVWILGGEGTGAPFSTGPGR